MDQLPHALYAWIAPCALGLALLVKTPCFRAGLACITALGAGAYGYQSRVEQAAWPYPVPEVEATLEGIVASVSQGQGWFRLRLDDLTAVDPQGLLLPQRIELRGEPAEARFPAIQEVFEGERLRLRARLRPVRSLSNPGVIAHERRLAHAGVGALARLVHPALFVHIADRDRMDAPFWRWRKELAERLLRLGSGGGLLAALSLGDRRGLSFDARKAIRRLGLSHLLAVSGLHLGLVGAGSYLLIWNMLVAMPFLAARFDLRVPAAWGCVGIAIGYALVAGWGLPVRRALVLLVAILLGFVQGRSRLRFHALAVAAMAILAVDPCALFDSGAQMSFGASGALLLSLDRESHERGSQNAHRFIREIRGLLRVSTVAFAATAPIAATTFGALAPTGLFWNLLAIPWVGLVLLPGAIVAAALTALDAWVWGPGSETVLWGIERLAHWSQQAVLALGPLVPTLRTNPQPAYAFLGLGTICALLAARMVRTRSKLLCAVGCAVALGLAPPSRIAPTSPRVVFFDVGKGDATLIQGNEGVILIDGAAGFVSGSSLGETVVVPALRALGVQRLDLMVATHSDRDHQGGLLAVLHSLSVASLWLPYGGLHDPAFDALCELARSKGVAIAERGLGDPVIFVGHLAIEPLWPPRNPEGLSRNEASLVLRATLPGGKRILLTGDLGHLGESRLLSAASVHGVSVEADWLKLGHHGSRTSSSWAFVEAVAPSEVLVSAGCHERFGMPHPEVIERARRLGARVWWTGRDGAVIVGAGDAIRRWRGKGSGCPVDLISLEASASTQ